MKKLIKRTYRWLQVYGLWILAVSLTLNVVFIIKNQQNVSSTPADSSAQSSSHATSNTFDKINPVKGYEIQASFGDLGPQMIASGVIDPEKFKGIYEKNGQPLSQENLTILTKGSNNKITITRENSYFLLNFFWAVGLANNTPILTDGEMTSYGQDQVGNFASTGGWTLAKGNAMDHYAKDNLIPLTDKQEALVKKVSSNIYRPCCDNPTSFPDCNHGMALLGVLELMASSGATENQMYEASKYFNAFWFPGNYADLADYFQNKEGKSFKDIPAQVLLSKDYSSATGWSNAKKWLQAKGIIQAPPPQGNGCGT